MDLKLQIYRMYDGCGDVVKGIASADFRGENFIGKLSDPRNVRQIEDFHRTPDTEVPRISEELADIALADAPVANALFAKIAEHQPDALGHLATALGLEGEGPVGLRLGVWDD